MDDRPAPHALAVEPELGRELVEPAAQTPLGMRLERELVAPVAQERGGVEGPFGEQRLRVDRQPRLALGTQDVAAVEVLVGDDELGLRGCELPDPGDRLVHEPPLERAALGLPSCGQLHGPALGLTRQRAVAAVAGRTLPEPPEHRGADPVRLLLVGHRPQLVAGYAALDEQAAAFRIVLEQPDGGVAVPERQCVRLVLALWLGEVELEHGLRPVAAHGRHHERDERVVRLAELELPEVGELAHETRQALEPFGPAGLVAPPRHRARDLELGQDARNLAVSTRAARGTPEPCRGQSGPAPSPSGSSTCPSGCTAPSTSTGSTSTSCTRRTTAGSATTRSASRRASRSRTTRSSRPSSTRRASTCT